eukprot:8352371-Prorocentrum_lima.AAC.1
MTSSLVGSEMCIRDRCSSMQSAAPSRHPTPAHVVLHGDANAHSVKAIPVSYTHLTLPTICSV